MPFTLVHPAAIIPLLTPLGSRAVPSALVFGSLAPDLVYFLPLAVQGEYSHSLTGLFAFCLPAGLLLYLLFHGIMRPALQPLLPRPLEARLAASSLHAGRSALRPRRTAALLLCLLLGAASHLLWDLFTHHNSVTANLFPALGATLWTIAGYKLHLYGLLQHLSTLLGLLVILLWLRHWYQHSPVAAQRPVPPNDHRYLRLTILLGSSVLLTLNWLPTPSPELNGLLLLRHLAGGIAFNGIPALALVLFVYGLAWQCWNRLKTLRAHHA